jgi:hypothetical protein
VSEKLVCRDRGLFVDLLVLVLTNRGRTRRKMEPSKGAPLDVLNLPSTQSGTAKRLVCDSRGNRQSTVEVQTSGNFLSVNSNIYLFGHEAFPSISSLSLMILW